MSAAAVVAATVTIAQHRDDRQKDADRDDGADDAAGGEHRMAGGLAWRLGWRRIGQMRVVHANPPPPEGCKSDTETAVSRIRSPHGPTGAA
jgi:hypothetical protein